MCRNVVDVICGNNDEPVATGLPEDENNVQTAQPYAMLYSLYPTWKHSCHEVKREVCYPEHVVQEVKRPREKCWVVQRVRCHTKVYEVDRFVCKHPHEVEDKEEGSDDTNDTSDDNDANDTSDDNDANDTSDDNSTNEDNDDGDDNDSKDDDDDTNDVPEDIDPTRVGLSDCRCHPPRGETRPLPMPCCRLVYYLPLFKK